MIQYKKAQYIYNYCTKLLARHVFNGAHLYNPEENLLLYNQIAESWRFPIIDTIYDESEPNNGTDLNEVTFIWCDYSKSVIDKDVVVFGTFLNLYEPIQLQRVEKSMYYTVTVRVPKGELFYYKFRVDNIINLDPINPQRYIDSGNEEWSQFFTDNCNILISFEQWERDLLQRLCMHILPFRTKDGQRFLDFYYHTLDFDEKRAASKLDETVGVVNYIDKVLAKQERHQLINYKICLELIDQLLRSSNVTIEPTQQDSEAFELLYNQMMSNNVPNWNYNRYSNPRYFIEILRRHTFTGAFCHPKHGGNVGAAGWEYLSEKFKDDNGNTLFDWKKSIEEPLGTNQEYHA